MWSVSRIIMGRPSAARFPLVARPRQGSLLPVDRLKTPQLSLASRRGQARTVLYSATPPRCALTVLSVVPRSLLRTSLDFPSIIPCTHRIPRWGWRQFGRNGGIFLVPLLPGTSLSPSVVLWSFRFSTQIHGDLVNELLGNGNGGLGALGGNLEQVAIVRTLTEVEQLVQTPRVFLSENTFLLTNSRSNRASAPACLDVPNCRKANRAVTA